MRRLLIALAALACVAAASDPSERLSDPAQEGRARVLMEEIRCVVCQNESIAESEADLARQLRLVVREQVRQGRTDPEIKAFLVRRYGDFVLLRPRLRSETVVLWAAPVIVIASGLLLCVFMLRNRRLGSDEALNAEEAERLSVLTDAATLRSDRPADDGPAR